MKFLEKLNSLHASVPWFQVFAWMIFILYFSLSPSPPDAVGGYTLNFDILHLVAYFVLCLLAANAFSNTHMYLPKKNPYLFSIFFCFLFGGFIEIAQSFVPGRTASIADVFYNLTAIIFYPTTIMIVKNIRKN